MGAGPTLGPADTNGSGVDAKHLDVGDMSDVSDVSKIIVVLNFQFLLSIFSRRMKKICRLLMPKVSGVRTSNRAFKRLSPSIHHVVDEKSFYPKKERCMVSTDASKSVRKVTTRVL